MKNSVKVIQSVVVFVGSSNCSSKESNPVPCSATEDKNFLSTFLKQRNNPINSSNYRTLSMVAASTKRSFTKAQKGQNPLKNKDFGLLLCGDLYQERKIKKQVKNIAY